jgi:hypothetical protein
MLLLLVGQHTLRNKGFSGSFHQNVFRTLKVFWKPIHTFFTLTEREKSVKVLWKTKKVFGEKPFPENL